ncbi:PHP domain-containing protein [Clostridium estertheticum]|uniref:PHP domain-containing protein n=1 Tax=Clostridium estertheticum TaxID=238834 RepID=UPI001C0CB3F9|nr:PHP domain-containing protein [Clostridium estertheticum]MBU3186543.1 PHP domain-containing protein [Clostridium estertheticum]
MLYYNFHKHDHKGNVKSLDVIVKMEDYCKRTVELGHTAIFTTNHGMQGDVFEAKTLADEYGLKYIVGVEAYYVEDRFEKDRTNNHLIIIALNSNGVRQINKAMSEANVTGVYYKPRIDREILMTYFNPLDVVITTACVAGILKNKELVLELHDKFKDNFFLETQDHNVPIQCDFNKIALQYHEEFGIKLIHANDSHYIKPKDGKNRTLFLKAKGIVYEEEAEFILDYPSYETVVERYKKQGILSDKQIREALDNTLIFNKATELDNINYDIKLPHFSKTPNADMKKIINERFKIEKQNMKPEDVPKYIAAVRYEMDIIERTGMENYFLIDEAVAKLAQSKSQEKYNGKLTNTGRGSAPSFYINKLLGLTNIDRLASPITLFPTRFMSAERILLAKSLPDIDLNTADVEPFIEASKELLGEKNCAWMISWKPLQDSSGFRLYCKSLDMDVSEYGEIAKDIDNYREDKQWKQLIEESKMFVGVVEGISESPCSMLIYDKNVAEEVGLIRTKEKVCCLLDGYNCDKYKYLKNDLLTVSVWSMIKEICELIGMPIPTILELEELLDDKTYKIYEDGLTCTINQFDSLWATGLMKRYKPHSVTEIGCAVAALRPGFATLLEGFINRQPYTTGVKELDALLDDSFHRLTFQESIMKYLVWLGVEEKETYDIVKKISKKKFKEKELTELKAFLLAGWLRVVGKEEGFTATWDVIESSAKYLFNASHSLSYAYDSLYGAYLKSHYPIEYYMVALNQYSGDEERTNRLMNELKSFDIKLLSPKFRYSKGEYFLDRKSNSIYKGIGSIKFLNFNVADELYDLRANVYNGFYDLLKDIKEKTSCNARQLDKLVKCDFFSEFGGINKILNFINCFDILFLKKAPKIKTIAEKIVLPGVAKIIENNSTPTAATYTKFDYDKSLQEIWNSLKNEDANVQDKIVYQKEILGYIDYTNEKLDKRYVLVSDIDTKYTPTLNTHCLNNGTDVICKISKKIWNNQPVQENNIIYIHSMERRFKQKKVGETVDTKGKVKLIFEKTDELIWFITEYNLIEDISEAIEDTNN